MLFRYWPAYLPLLMDFVAENYQTRACDRVSLYDTLGICPRNFILWPLKNICAHVLETRTF